MANNKLTWHHHLYGDFTDPKKPIKGLVSQLAKRVGLLSKLVKIIPSKRFKLLVNGLFMSKLLYCLPLFGNIWYKQALGDKETRFHSFTKSNLRALQTLQNKVLRLLAGCGYDTPVLQLLDKTNMLSVNQLVAFTTIMTVFKTKQSGEPKYIDRRMNFNQRGRINNVKFRLSRAREGFMFTGAQYFSLLPNEIRLETKISRFKKKLKT